MPGRHITRILSAVLIWGAAATIARAAEVQLRAPDADDALLRQLRAASLSIETEADTSAAPQDILAAARADYARLIGVLYGAGYYGPSIRINVDGREASEISPLNIPTRIRTVRIRVATGPRFVFGQARVAPIPPQADIPEDYAPGQIARSELIQDAAAAAITSWRDLGHAKAEIGAQRITANHANRTLSSDLRVNPGPRLRFGTLRFRGETRVREERLHEIAGLPTGKVFSPDELDDAAERLRRTGVFRSVALTEDAGIGAGNAQDITAEIVDQKRRRMGFGAEISSLEGLGLSAMWMHRNLLGGAERLRFDAEIGGIGGNSGGEDYRLSARFDRPATFQRDTDFFALAELAEEDEPDYFERRAQVGFGFSRIFSDTRSGEMAVIYRYSEVEDDLGSRNFSHLTFPVGYTIDRRDSALDTVRGEYLSAEVMPFLAVGDSESGGRLTLDGRAYRPLGERLVLAGRFQIGSVIGPDARDVPPNLLFFSGGGDTVRGQPYQSLAVERANGDRLGGRSFIGLSAEMRADLRGNFGIVGFVDAGFIGADSVPGQDGAWHSGAGIGLRYKTAIGPVRFDLAAPISGDTGDGPQIYIGIGQAF
ncbi:autotransporter assembly complex protein TamA [Actibacterium ureilyticum]|uniref:autotransporter assembly complex protein TamA n=1 Tax=Actibacterium ureilyticum TaxID=1590614 RepID=UPI001FED01F1|nr:autotransporter assembly complex family protein [Actibacterium ureilyticum]